MDFNKDRYIIVEIIPDHSNSDLGKICQIQALKLDGLNLIDRFDYRLNKDKIENIAILKAIDYDNNNFKYTFDSDTILNDFKIWCEDYNLLLIEPNYTYDYLKDINNHKELVYPYLNMKHSYSIFDEMIDKYHLEPSNHLVDLIYEAIILESNKD